MDEGRLSKLAELEALLFLYGEPIALDKAAKLLGVNGNKLTELLAELKKSLSDSNRGLVLVENKGSVQLGTNPDLSFLTEKLIKEEFQENLTPASLEALTIIAYAGPITRAEIDFIRGVNSTFILRNLYLRGLVDRGTDPKRSNVYLYTASNDFLKHIGLKNISELPDYGRITELMERVRQRGQADHGPALESSTVEEFSQSASEANTENLNSEQIK